MTRRTQEQWLVLFDEQKSSGLNNTEFCKTKNISPKYFSLRRSQLIPKMKKAAHPSSGFVPAYVLPSPCFIEVEHHHTRLKFPAHLSATWLAQFVLELG